MNFLEYHFTICWVSRVTAKMFNVLTEFFT